METAIFSNHGTNVNRISQIVFDSSVDQIGGSILNSDNTLYEWRYWPVTRPGTGAERIQNIVYSTASDFVGVLVNSSWHYLPTINILASHLTTHSYNYSYSIAAGATYNTAFNPTITGYNCLGIIRFSTNNVDVLPVNIDVGSGSYALTIKNTSSSTKTGTLGVTALFVKVY